MRGIAFRLLGVVGLVAALAMATAVEVGSQQGTLVPEELVFGMVPSRPATVLGPPVEGLGKLLLAYLQANGFPQIKSVKSVIPESYTATVEALGTARLHVGMLGPFQIVQSMDRYGTIPVSAAKRGESLRFRSQFMAHLLGPYSNLFDLINAVKEGKAVRFSYGGSSTSTSGFLFPCKTLKDLGILPGDFRNFKTIRAANHLASAIAVYKKDVDVGVAFDDVRVEGLDFDTTKKELGWKEGDPLPSTRVIIIGYSDWIPNDGTVVIKELRPDLIKAIKDGMVAISKTEDGKKFATASLNATEFVRVPEDFDMVQSLKAVRAVADDIQPNLAKCENQ